MCVTMKRDEERGCFVATSLFTTFDSFLLKTSRCRDCSGWGFLCWIALHCAGRRLCKKKKRNLKYLYDESSSGSGTVTFFL